LKSNFGKDRYNLEEESFDQEREKIDTPYSINIPTRFYFRKKWHNGWLNIDPFRGSLIIGTPGSGKSYGIINPAIRQLIHKNFSVLLYDFKYPDLTNIAYSHYLEEKKTNKSYNHSFYVLNPDDVEGSARVNPIRKEYVNTLAEAQDVAETIVLALQKGGESGGSAQFFTQSAINFLSCCVYYLAKTENGKYSSLPHLMSFLNLSYQEIFDAIFKVQELESLLSTFKSAYENEAFEQLEGQLGTLKIYITRLATKENYWIFTEDEDEFEFKLSDKTNPSILVMANSPQTQNINSAVFSTVINRVINQVNSKDNLPTAIIADEFPTVYFHSIENTIATARSNKVAVILGLQELTQLRQYYKKQIADTLASVVGNVISGSVREKQTLTWIESLIGKAKQVSQSISVSNNGTSITTNEKMDFLVPQSKIATLQTGQMVGVLAESNLIDEKEYTKKSKSVFNAKINLDSNEIKREEKGYRKTPRYYSMVSDTTKESITTVKKEMQQLSLNKKIDQDERKSQMKVLKSKLKDFDDQRRKEIDQILNVNFNKIRNDIQRII
jgi:type IV secretory pathway TraG/TraD family ATPase VirD4